MTQSENSIYIGATSMLTCLGDEAETVKAISNGISGLKPSARFGMYAGCADIPIIGEYTRFESACISVIAEVASKSAIDLKKPNVQIIISSTKGNIDQLAESGTVADRVYIYNAALAITDFFGCARRPVVISNACISGLSAMVVARDLFAMERDLQDVIVVGCDVISEFIASGFASFKSVSTKPCKPYDAQRDGLTLGEACGAIVLTTDNGHATAPTIYLKGGAISNDANHISGPSRTGDGLYFAISEAMIQAHISAHEVGFVNAHGTATRYNDEMESKALALSQLTSVPLNSMKGYIGHTLGASGVVETILCIHELRHNMVFGTKGFNSSDTPHQLSLSASAVPLGKPCCVKTASGFGGCNAAIVLDSTPPAATIAQPRRNVHMVAEYSLPQSDRSFADFVRSEYKKLNSPNMKFYKMSDLSKAMYVAVEKLLSIEDFEETATTRRAIIIANKSASLDADTQHQAIVNRRLPEGASPSVFVYTLPNVATGEICIRHKIQGNNTFFIENDNSHFVEKYAEYLITADYADAVVCGWCEYFDERWDVNLKLLKGGI